ncbi:MAG: hypothetical protein IPI16_09480 [Comamonadaceae bacterium]|nr:hypothetical protein [Comamonadaceae bacterium]
MFKNLFKRGKAASEETTKPPVAGMAAPDTVPAPLEQASRAPSNRSWSDGGEMGAHDPLPSPEVVEGNGGNTDWGLWTEAVKDEENAFAPTEPMPLRAR